jgi:2-polyprenyl-3-methyl-5-hydroxy-6-metoxy-1,4-benzoquinol methylase
MITDWRSYQKELLDEVDIPPAALAQTLRELNVVNTLLGGHATTKRGLLKLLTNCQVHSREPLHIAEIGCGGGDNLRVIHKLLKRRGIAHRITGIDMKRDCVEFAAAHSGLPATISTWVESRYEEVSWPEGTAPHLIFSSLFCHHFTDEELIAQLQWLQKNTQTGFFINDLHRNIFAYRAIQFFTRLFSKSYLVKNDAPLSVLRAFKRKEWKSLFARAGLLPPAVQWRWAFRFLVVSFRKNEGPCAPQM